MFVEVNLNPYKRTVGDCVIRAISCAEEENWDDTLSEHERQAIMDCINRI